MDLREFGFDDHFARAFEALDREGLVPGRVTSEDRLGYVVATARGEVVAELPKGKRHAARSAEDVPAVGDFVGVSDARGKAMVEVVLARRSKFSRRAVGGRDAEQVVAANVDTVFIVVGLDGDFNLRRIERYMTLAHDSGSEPVVLLNKADACTETDVRLVAARAVAPLARVEAVSALQRIGLETVRSYLGVGRTVAFLGSSGVGKSSLVNALLGEERMATQQVREHDSRGRHTTSARALVLVPGGGAIIDTPGMRELQLWADVHKLEGAFPDVADLAARCRFSDCRHEVEPGCAVRDAVERGVLDPERKASFAELRAEIEALAVRQKRSRRERS